MSTAHDQKGAPRGDKEHNSRAEESWLTRIMPFAAGIMALPCAYYARTWQSFTTVRNICPNAFCDFVDYYYPMGEAIFRTALPVSGFLYSPFNAILLAVFPPLGLNVSLVLWGILQALSVWLYVLLFRRLVPAGLPIQLLFVALTLTSYPLLLNLMAGQVSGFMTVGVLGMLALYGRDQRVAAAGSLAFAVSFKYYPIIFLAPFAARRDTRFLLVAAATSGAFLLVVPALLLGGGDTLGFYGALLDAFRDSGWVVENPHSQYFPHVVLRLAGGAGLDIEAGLPLLRSIGFGVAAANMGLVFLVQRARLRHADLWSAQLVFLTIPFVLKTSWAIEFIFISFTQAFLAWRLLEREEAAPGADTAGRRSQVSVWRERVPHGRTAVIWSLLLVSIVFPNIFFFNLFGSFSGYGFVSFIFWADLLLLTVLYTELLPHALRQIRVRHVE
jgi:hypothetical protein